jgi:hypothetical protein
MKQTIFITEENQGKFHTIAPNLPNNQIEIIQLDIPTQHKMDQILDETPWQWFGAFKDDPTWGALFDDIELKRFYHSLM